jgi:hypothetical protein
MSKMEIDRLLGKTPKLLGKIRSILDKIDDIKVLEDGRVKHNYLRVSMKTPDLKKLRKKYKKLIEKK